MSIFTNISRFKSTQSNFSGYWIFVQKGQDIKTIQFYFINRTRKFSLQVLLQSITL